ncbi:MAG: ABC transporter ATP-binding protein [Aestuariivita sp.]|nr:ABC transporter ATP-binding protein [Aestuariivita sp.]MCY4201158.1 ABC transporter ATP-binding protein [Aestuariivita sp.]
MAEIVVQNVRKTFGDFVAVSDSSFTVQDGEFFVLLGPSGCGKTTTLRMIAGLEVPTSGQIFLDGAEVSQTRPSERDIAFVFQMFALYPHMNVRKNIAYPLVSQGLSRAVVRAKVDEVAQILGIDHILDNPVSGLSGGDRQRVALGRAIVRNPKAFMMDEPLGALDAEFRESMAEELRSLHDRMGATTVYVTHDQLEAMQMGDKIIVMNHGVIEQFGTPQEIYDYPASLFVADFIGSPSMNFLPFQGTVRKGATQVLIDKHTITIPELLEDAGGELILGVRPEHVFLTKNSGLPAKVIATEYLGTSQIVTLETAKSEIKARIDADQRADTGGTVQLEFHSPAISIFNEASGRALQFDRGLMAG